MTLIDFKMIVKYFTYGVLRNVLGLMMVMPF